MMLQGHLTDEEAFELLERAVRSLAEHFDTVQIFVTAQQGTETNGFNKGAGNWYARVGQINSWVQREAEVNRAQARADFTRLEDDD